MPQLFYALFSGLLLAISWPTYGVPFFIFFALVPLLLMEHEISKFSKKNYKTLRIFGLSFLSFLIWNIVTTGWLYGSKNPDGSPALLAVLIPVIANSMLYSLVFLSYHYYKKIQGTYWGLVFFVAIWMAFEKLHLSWELTWPWLNLGNVFAEYPTLIQWYDTLGATGGSFWVLLVNVFAFYTLRIFQAERKRKPLIKNSGILIGGILIPMLISYIQYINFKEEPIGEVSVLMLQPDLDPYNEKYQKDSLTILSELLSLAQEHSTGKIDYYIGPETSLPGSGSISEKGFKDSPILGQVQSFVSSKPGSVFATGISSHRFFSDLEPMPKNAYKTSYGDWVESYNTAIQVTATGVSDTYHKGKLVPGVEIFPYMHLLKPILGDAMLNFGGTIASLGSDENRSVFKNPYNKGIMAPIICYESVYGAYTAEFVRNGANFLGIMTNDSWWGVSEGHKQLLSYARLRAIENRREIARSANSGISAHIDARGEIVADTFYGDQTALHANIKLYNELTTYSKVGDLLTIVSLYVLGFLIMYTLIKQVQNRRSKAK